FLAVAAGGLAELADLKEDLALRRQLEDVGVAIPPVAHPLGPLFGRVLGLERQAATEIDPHVVLVVDVDAVLLCTPPRNGVAAAPAVDQVTRRIELQDRWRVLRARLALRPMDH